jgi:hypothetical protein
MHFLEIHYQIFKHFTVAQILSPEMQEQQAVAELKAKERALENRKKFIRSLRHGKFGT